jgi:hypothetical protein
MVMRAMFSGLISLLFFAYAVSAQTDTLRNQPESTAARKPVLSRTDSAPVMSAWDSAYLADSIASASRLQLDSLLQDSIKRAAAIRAAGPVTDTSTYWRYENLPWLGIHKPARYMPINYHEATSSDELFYVMAGILLVVGLIRFLFSKYFRNLFLLFMQTSLRQKQTRDQLLQDNLASLLTNFLFILSGGLYVTLVIRQHQWSVLPFWWLAGGSAAVLLVVYLAKYLFLQFTGWVFNAKEAAGSYVFVVFLVNKVLGILLIPFLLLFAFANTTLVQVAATLSLGLLLLLFGYRYWVSFTAIRSKLKVNALHFLLYLCAVELLPLLLIYKVLIRYFTGTL